MKQNNRQTIATTSTQKEHLKFFSGVKLNNNGKPVTIVTAKTKLQSSCGLKMTEANNMVDFNYYRKNFPEYCCKKCLVRFEQLMTNSKDLA